MVATTETNLREIPALRRLEWFDRRRLFFASLVIGALIYGQYQFYKLPASGDRANWDYFAQVISRGGVPYRDVVNIKGPMSAYIGAAAIVALRPLGVRDVLAVRIAYMALGILIIGFTFLLACDYFNSLRAGILAALILLSFVQFIIANCGGIQPKTPMILFGLVALWAIIKDRPMLAGLFGMFSALCWQPGLLFVGAAGLAFSRYLTSWRDLKVVRLLVGALLPLAAQILYLWAQGGLRDFYLWTIHFNLTVYAPQEMRSASNFAGLLVRLVTRVYRYQLVYFLLAVPAFIAVLVAEIRRAIRGGMSYLKDAAPRHAILISPIVYFAFCAIDMQGVGDMFPFLPFISAFAALALVYLLDWAVDLLRSKKTAPYLHLIRSAGFAALLFLASAAGEARAFMFQVRSPTLQEQEAEVAEMTSHMQPGDKIFAHGLSEVLVLSGLTNASKYFFLDRGKDTYLDTVEPGGFNGWFERLKAERPKIVALSRLKPVEHSKDFVDWVHEDYVLHTGRVLEYYLRKDQ